MRVLSKRQTIHRQLESAQEINGHLYTQLRQSERLGGLGLAWAVTAHEINNLLTPLTNYAQLAMQHPDDTALSQKAHEKAIVLGQRAGVILEKVMAMAAGDGFEKSPVAVADLIEDVLLCIGRDFAKDGITLVIDCPAETLVCGDRTLLGQVVMNLILNARRAMQPGGGTLTLRADSTPSGTRIEIRDTGCGMTQEALSQIFKPFYTTDGNGLGLVFCKQIIEAHNGGIQAESQLDEGTTFRILLPAD